MTGNNKEATSQLAFILKRWPQFSAAQILLGEVKSGRKPTKKTIQRPKNDSLKLHSLNKGSWLMQRVQEENEQKQKQKEIKMKLN